MPMQMGWRWYGEGNDKISLSDIKQIPGVTSIVWALHDKMPGEIWEVEEIAKVKKQLDEYGFNMDVVESVNVHDDIKIGLPTRDQYIENYKQTIQNLSQFGVKVIINVARSKYYPPLLHFGQLTTATQLAGCHHRHSLGRTNTLKLAKLLQGKLTQLVQIISASSQHSAHKGNSRLLRTARAY